MSDLLTILNNRRGPAILQYHQVARSSPQRASGQSKSEQPDAGQGRGADQVELSDRARAYVQPARTAPIRHELVQHMRDSIARGDYLSPGKLEFAVDRLHEELSGLS